MSNINKWLNEDTGEIITSESRPDGEHIFPCLSLNRVHGHKYEPYIKGSHVWRKAANKALANHARSNHEIKTLIG